MLTSLLPDEVRVFGSINVGIADGFALYITNGGFALYVKNIYRHLSGALMSAPRCKDARPCDAGTRRAG
jgi:hypothetical protein